MISLSKTAGYRFFVSHKLGTSSCIDSARKDSVSSPPELDNEPCTSPIVQTKVFPQIKKVDSTNHFPNQSSERHQTYYNQTIVGKATDQCLSGLENQPRCSTPQQSTKTFPAEEVDCKDDSLLNKGSMFSSIIEINQSSNDSSVLLTPKAKNPAKLDNKAPCCTITQPIQTCRADYALTSSPNSNFCPSPSLDYSRRRTGSSVSEPTTTPSQRECQSTQPRAIELVCSSEDEMEKCNVLQTASEGPFP